MSTSDGYPVTVDCELPNGELPFTCRYLSTFDYNQELVDQVYATVDFSLGLQKQIDDMHNIAVRSHFPWAAMKTHNDDRRWIVKVLPKDADNVTSGFSPTSPNDLRLVMTEGPSYAIEHIDGGISKIHGPQSPGGINPRLIPNLQQQMRVLPNSTQIIGVVASQVHDLVQFLTQ